MRGFKFRTRSVDAKSTKKPTHPVHDIQYIE